MSGCSNRIVGYSIDERMTAQFAVTALRSAVARRQPKRVVGVHRDRGGRFRSRAFRRGGLTRLAEPIRPAGPLLEDLVDRSLAKESGDPTNPPIASPRRTFGTFRSVGLRRLCSPPFDHAGAVGRVGLGHLDDRLVTGSALPRTGRQRSGGDGSVDGLAADASHPSHNGRATSGSDHSAGSGHTDAHVQSRKSSPATSTS
jgi:hypothetical protein